MMTTNSTLRVMCAAATLCLAFAAQAIARGCANCGDPARCASRLPKPSELPDCVVLLPPPLALCSAAEALDQEIARHALTLRDTKRFRTFQTGQARRRLSLLLREHSHACSALR
jgi:hypothetical protein